MRVLVDSQSTRSPLAPRPAARNQTRLMNRQPSRFRLVVFDVAGTTVLDGDLVVECMQAALGDRVNVPRQDVRDVMGLPKPLAIKHLLSSHGNLSGDALQQ